MRKRYALGATVIQTGSEYAEATARNRQAETGALFCHAYDHAEMVAGNGTLALELCADNRRLAGRAPGRRDRLRRRDPL